LVRIQGTIKNIGEVGTKEKICGETQKCTTFGASLSFTLPFSGFPPVHLDNSS